MSHNAHLALLLVASAVTTGKGVFDNYTILGVYLFGSVVGALLGTAVEKEKDDGHGTAYWAQQTLLSLGCGLVICPAIIRWWEIPLLPEYILLVSALFSSAGWILFKMVRAAIPHVLHRQLKTLKKDTEGECK